VVENAVTMVFNKVGVKGRRKQLRHTMPEAEVILWSQLKDRQIFGIKFRRQYSVGQYVVDFYCAKKKLAIEIDGESHYAPNASERDEKRQQWIEQFGIRFLRFTNNDVRKNLYSVLDAIEEAVCGTSTEGQATPLSR
jgi:very-short-patch-repair endonuclease